MKTSPEPGGIMAQSTRFNTDLSQIELLLNQQKYEEALFQLTQLVDENPLNIQIRIYRLLTVRILMLREALAQRISPAIESRPIIAQSISSRPGGTLMDFITPRLKQYAESARRAIEAARPATPITRAVLAVAVAGLFVTPVTLLLGVAGQQLSGATEPHGVLSNLSTAKSTALEVNARTEGRDEQSLNRPASNHLPHLQRVNGAQGTTLKPRIASTPSNSATVLHAETADAGPDNQARLTSRQHPSAKDLHPLYKTRGSLSLRAQPRFGSEAIQQVAAGTRVHVLAADGKWLKVKTDNYNAVGYLRKEFVVAAKPAP
jgi:hypothetical protein